MKLLFPIEVDIGQLLKLIKQKQPNALDAWRRYWPEHIRPTGKLHGSH